jgi:hypothetical protein
MKLLLIFVGLILVILNVLSIKKQNKSFKGVLGNAMENIHDEDIRIGELRREFSESILELQSEIMEMRQVLEENNKSPESYNTELDYKSSNEDKSEIIIEEPITRIGVDNTCIEDSNKHIKNGNSEKIERIKELFSKGLSEEEIAEILHLGKGEVLLIKDLYIR